MSYAPVQIGSIDVVVPTYCRPLLLERCLLGVIAQTRPADRVIVVSRGGDAASELVLNSLRRQHRRIYGVMVDEPGVVAALTAGVAFSTGDVIAFTDDDAVPRYDWLERLLSHFANSEVGGVGGRDVIATQQTPLTDAVGRFRPSGRLSGLHHLGTGSAREVDVLKGVNMAFRAEALALPAAGVLRGKGAQVDFEVITCAWAKRNGWRLIYDPAIQVDHESGDRTGPGTRERPTAAAVFDAAFNSAVAASSISRSALFAHAGYGLAVGTRDRPGLMRTATALIRDEAEVTRRAIPAIAGRLVGLLTSMVPPGRRESLVIEAMALRKGAQTGLGTALL